MEEEKNNNFISIDWTNLIPKVLGYIFAKIKNFKKESELAKKIESETERLFENYASSYSFLEDIAENDKLSNFIDEYCKTFDKKMSITNFIKKNNITGKKASTISSFLQDLSSSILDIYVNSLSQENKILRNSITNDVEEIIKQSKYDISKIVNNIQTYFFDAKFDQLNDYFQTISAIDFNTDDKILIDYINSIIYNSPLYTLKITTKNIEILKFLIRINLWCGYYNFDNIINLNYLDSNFINLIKNKKNGQLQKYISYNQDNKTEENHEIKKYICESILIDKFTRSDMTYCKIFYESNQSDLKNKLCDIIYEISLIFEIRNDYEINKTKQLEDTLNNRITSLDKTLSRFYKLNPQIVIPFISNKIIVQNYNMVQLEEYIDSLPSAYKENERISYPMLLSSGSLSEKNPLIIISSCIQNNDTMLLKMYTKLKYKKPCTSITTLFKNYRILDTFTDLDLFSIYAMSVIYSNKYNKTKTLTEINKYKKNYKDSINYLIIMGFYYNKYDKKKLPSLNIQIITLLKNSNIGGFAFEDLVKYIGETKNEPILKELLCLNLNRNAKLVIVDLLSRFDLKFFCHYILEILSSIQNLNNYFLKIQADCLFYANEKILSLNIYKLLLKEKPTNNLYSIILSISIEHNQEIEEDILSKMKLIKDFGVQYNLGLYFMKHQNKAQAKIFYMQSLLLNDKENDLKGGMFSLIIEQDNPTFVCNKVKPDVAVYLEGEDSILLFIHNNGVNFTDESNSFCAKHCNYKNNIINDLRGKNVGDSCSYMGKQYKISNILPIDKIVFDDCMGALEQNNMIQTIQTDNVEYFKNYMKNHLAKSNDYIHNQIKKYNDLKTEMYIPYSLLAKSIGKHGLDGYISIIRNPSIYKINSTNHIDTDKKIICSYDAICLLALTKINDINFSNYVISKTTKNYILNELTEKFAELESNRQLGHMYLESNNLFMIQPTESDKREMYSFYSNILNILENIDEIQSNNMFDEKNYELYDVLHSFYTDYEIETLTCARENSLILFTDDISIIKISNHYQIQNIGINSVILKNLKGQEMLNALIALKNMGFYNFVDQQIITTIDNDVEISDYNCKKLLEISSCPKEFESVVMNNYRHYLNNNKDKIYSNKVLKEMLNYLRQDLFKQYELQTEFDIKESKIICKLVPKK